MQLIKSNYNCQTVPEEQSGRPEKTSCDFWSLTAVQSGVTLNLLCSDWQKKRGGNVCFQKFHACDEKKKLLGW